MKEAILSPDSDRRSKNFISIKDNQMISIKDNSITHISPTTNVFVYS